MPQLEHIEAIEQRLWSAADTRRANSKHASNEYFLRVMGLVFLRHAYSRYLAVHDPVTAGLPTRGARKRTVSREGFLQKNAIFLRLKARFDHLVALPHGADRAAAVIAAMESIEEDYASLRGVLPKGEYQALDNGVLGDLLRTLNADELKKVSGDVFGRIYRPECRHRGEPRREPHGAPDLPRSPPFPAERTGAEHRTGRSAQRAPKVLAGRRPNSTP